MAERHGGAAAAVAEHVCDVRELDDRMQRDDGGDGCGRRGDGCEDHRPGDEDRKGGAGRKERGAHIELGRRGEQAARAFLMRRGFDVIETNWTCPAGEVDIVARDDDSIHFVEVKTRRGTGRGFPEEAVDAGKRGRYERIAEYYLRQFEDTELSVHFDIIGIVTTAPDRAFLRFHCDAFSVG